MARRPHLRLALLALVLLAAAPVAAQQVTTYDKTPLGEYGQVYWPYELDGNPQTREWLGMRVNPVTDLIEYRVMVACPSGPVHTAWFHPYDVIKPTEFTVGGLIEVGDRWVFVAQGYGFYHELRFTVPVCR